MPGWRGRPAVYGALTALVMTLASCATAPDVAPVLPGDTTAAPGAPVAPALGFLSRIKVPESVEPVLKLHARGVQVFRCEARGSGYAWTFRLPEADLFDASGRAVVRHGANFSFEHADGSRLLTNVVEFDEAPSPGDLRWLLLSARSFGEGALSGITYAQRVNTAGGMPPTRCEAAEQNRLLRVGFSADFVFYKPR